MQDNTVLSQSDKRLAADEQQDVSDISSLERELTSLDEMIPIESPAVVCGKWGCLVS